MDKDAIMLGLKKYEKFSVDDLIQIATNEIESLLLKNAELEEKHWSESWQISEYDDELKKNKREENKRLSAVLGAKRDCIVGNKKATFYQFCLNDGEAIVEFEDGTVKKTFCENIKFSYD